MVNDFFLSNTNKSKNYERVKVKDISFISIKKESYLAQVWNIPIVNKHFVTFANNLDFNLTKKFFDGFGQNFDFNHYKTCNKPLLLS